MLLSHLKWDHQECLAKLSDEDHREDFFKTANVLNPFKAKKKKKLSRAKIECAICCTKLSASVRYYLFYFDLFYFFFGWFFVFINNNELIP